jgi:hypothetical protein
MYATDLDELTEKIVEFTQAVITENRFEETKRTLHKKKKKKKERAIFFESDELQEWMGIDMMNRSSFILHLAIDGTGKRFGAINIPDFKKKFKYLFFGIQIFLLFLVKNGVLSPSIIARVLRVFARCCFAICISCRTMSRFCAINRLPASCNHCIDNP